MKTARRYLARTLYVLIYLAAAPLAIAFVVFGAMFEFCAGMLDSLEAIANDK